MSKKEKIICPKCGSKENPTAKFCSNCGTPLKEDVPSDSRELARSYMVIFGVMILALLVSLAYNLHLIGKASGKQQVNQTAAAENPHAGSTAAIDENKVKELENHIKKHPNDPAPIIDLGNYYFDHGLFRKAIAYYEQALMLNPNMADVWVDKGVAYFNLQNAAEAEKCFKKALEINPSHVKALYNLGIVYHVLKRMDQVVKYWELLIQRAPDSPEAKQAMQFLDQIKNRVDG